MSTFSVCEGSLDESEGKIFSPNKNYNLSTYSCQWTRNNDLTQNQTIVFKVTNMTSNATDPCEIRPLRIRSGNSSVTLPSFSCSHVKIMMTPFNRVYICIFT